MSSVTLYGFDKKAEHPSSSGFCQKVETFCRATGTKYECVATKPWSAPKKKLPYIVHDGNTVPDSTFIIQYLVSSGTSRDLDAPLTPRQKADSRAWQVYVEEFLYDCIVYTRWMDAKNYAVTVEENFGAMSWPIRRLLAFYFRRLVGNTMWTKGIGRHSPKEIEQLIREAMKNVEVLVGDGSQYIFGTDEPAVLDVVICGFCLNSLGSDGNPLVNEPILGSSALVAYLKRMTEKLFPEYKRILERLDKLK